MVFLIFQYPSVGKKKKKRGRKGNESNVSLGASKRGRKESRLKHIFRERRKRKQIPAEGT